ncbi:putative glutaredoxin grx [Tripterygium wilfordii]|uniref:Putative glutaredoxin grx n=1 Tax=Tripterygium wilfordii TaxID=458696 RepID=A0A7J7CF65_TRIWF|nr:glutaredoxin-C9-like [Tripterygium wilfordii]XP_038681141.1 glutaredoxin-C9-like [Tripterygium wilfordii]KAF5732585.1 putative glutaredoxin grx [Tripterygium wilfordii]
MQQAIPYKSWLPIYTTNNNPLNPSSLTQKSNNGVNDGGVLRGSKKKMGTMVSENAIIVFAKRGCCMGHVVRRLLLGLGVNPPLYEIDEEEEDGVLKELMEIVNKGKKVQLPAVFIGGALFGGLDRVMATHISGELVPILKEAGALWL